MRKIEPTWFDKLLNHQHLALLVLTLVGVDYLQSIMMYDALNPHLGVVFSFRYVAIFLLLSTTLAHGLEKVPYCALALLGADLLFYCTQYDWLTTSQEWIRILMPFSTNVALSSLALCTSWIWGKGYLFATALEAAVYLSAFGILCTHMLFDGLLDQWVLLLQQWMTALDLTGVAVEQLAFKMALSMTANIVNGYVLMPLLFITLITLYVYSSRHGKRQLFKREWLSYRLSWSSFYVSLAFYMATYFCILITYLQWVDAVWFHQPAFYLFDTVQFLPCVAGLSLVHTYIEFMCSKKKARRAPWLILLFLLFYGFSQLFVWVGLADKILDIRKRYRLTVTS